MLMLLLTSHDCAVVCRVVVPSILAASSTFLTTCVDAKHNSIRRACSGHCVCRGHPSRTASIMMRSWNTGVTLQLRKRDAPNKLLFSRHRIAQSLNVTNSRASQRQLSLTLAVLSEVIMVGKNTLCYVRSFRPIPRMT